MALSRCLGGNSPSVRKFNAYNSFLSLGTTLTIKGFSSSFTLSNFPSISSNFSCSLCIFHTSSSLKGLKISRFKCNPLSYGFMSRYFMNTYTKKLLIDSILALSNPRPPLSYISTNSRIKLLTLSHQYFETIPHTPSVVWFAFPTQVPGSYGVHWPFLDSYWIPNHKNDDPNFLEASQHISSVVPIVRLFLLLSCLCNKQAKGVMVGFNQYYNHCDLITYSVHSW